MFLRHAFDPITDLKRNTWGVLEFAGNKPGLEHEWDQYLRMRWEDDNGEGSGRFHQVSDDTAGPPHRSRHRHGDGNHHPPATNPPASHPEPRHHHSK
jgi:hypothetical protein